jgi:hypothetical protein
MDDFLNPLRGYIEVEVRDREGRIVGRGRHEMRSFLNNFLRAIKGFMTAGANQTTGTGAITFTVVKLDGTSGSASAEIWSFAAGATRQFTPPISSAALDNDDTYGIVVGTGTTSVSLGDYNLASKIAHGTGSGQLDYDVTDYTDLGLDTGVSPPVYRCRLVRTFKNLSGASININEVGIISRSNTTAVGDVKFLIARDMLPSTYTVPNGGSATVAITVEVVVG